MSEDFSPGQAIGTIKATDPDKLGALQFELIDAADDKHFELDKISGVLKLIDVLDRETSDSYRLNVRVSDGVQHTDTIVSVQVRAEAFRFITLRDFLQVPEIAFRACIPVSVLVPSAVYTTLY